MPFEKHMIEYPGSQAEPGPIYTLSLAGNVNHNSRSRWSLTYDEEMRSLTHYFLIVVLGQDAKHPPVTGDSPVRMRRILVTRKGTGNEGKNKP